MDKVLYKVEEVVSNVYKVIGTEPMRELVGGYAEVGFEDNKYITIINYDIYKEDEIGDSITKAIDKYRLDNYIKLI